MSKLTSYLELARPGHWVKNLLVFAALLFSRNYLDPQAWLAALSAFGMFCLLASGVYCWNDVLDRHTDARLPRTRTRPIPSGRITAGEAMVLGTVLLAVAMGLAWLICPGLGIIAAAYLALNLAYNVSLRNHPIADVITIALGFVLRAVAGGVAIGVPVSVWLVVCTFMLCLFLGLIKRRGEVVALGEQGQQKSPRAVHAFYTVTRLDHMLAVSAGLAVVMYTMYCLVSPHSPGVHMVWTIPVVVYGMFRLYSLAVGTEARGPVDLVRRDAVIWIVAAVWAGMVIAVMRLGGHPLLQGWLSR